MRAHEAGWAHAEGARGPAWLQVPEDPNALVTHLWSTSAATNDNGALVVGGVDMRDLVADPGSPAYLLDEDDFRGSARGFPATFAPYDVHYPRKSFLCHTGAP